LKVKFNILYPVLTHDFFYFEVLTSIHSSENFVFKTKESWIEFRCSATQHHIFVVLKVVRAFY